MRTCAWTGLCRSLPFIILITFSHSACTQDPYLQKRLAMVQSQIIDRGVSDPAVIHAMREVERHRFVPENQVAQAYRDGPLPIGYGQTISQPYIVAYMTEVLNLKREEKVLEIGTGSGYQAAVLAEICDSVFSIEVVPGLGESARQKFSQLGYSNIRMRIGDGYLGWPEYAPFDAIIVTCAPTHIPQALKDQLQEGGRMIIPVGERYVQELVLLEKKNGKIRQRSVLPVRFVPMVDEKGELY